MSRILKKRRTVHLQSREYELLPPEDTRSISNNSKDTHTSDAHTGFKHVTILFSHMCMRKLV